MGKSYVLQLTIGLNDKTALTCKERYTDRTSRGVCTYLLANLPASVYMLAYGTPLIVNSQMKQS